LCSIALGQAPPAFPTHLGARHKFPADPKFIWKYSPAIAEALDHFSNRLWAVGVCADDQFHPEMQLVTGEFAIWASGLVTAYKAMPYSSAPFAECPRIIQELNKRLVAPDKHVEEQSLRHEGEDFFKESPLVKLENHEYRFAYLSLYSDHAWMGTGAPFEPMTRNDVAEWLAMGFGDSRFREELRKQPTKYRFETISRGEALLRLFKVSKAIVGIVNVSAGWVEPLIAPKAGLIRFVKRDVWKGGQLTIAVATAGASSPDQFVIELKANGRVTKLFAKNVAEFAAQIQQLKRIHPQVSMAGDYYSGDIGVRIRSPFPPLLKNTTLHTEARVKIGACEVGFGFVPKLQESAYKSFVAAQSATPASQIESSQVNMSHAFLWRSEMANEWNVVSSRFWTYYAFARGIEPFHRLPTPLVEPWTYYGRP
ncbi:MAG TPA: hypothetical protein VK171_16250, partial [Fimbriimonas sp.]|nr:hypothetical protein [Fimbriimonas sp.]